MSQKNYSDYSEIIIYNCISNHENIIFDEYEIRLSHFDTDINIFDYYVYIPCHYRDEEFQRVTKYEILFFQGDFICRYGTWKSLSLNETHKQELFQFTSKLYKKEKNKMGKLANEVFVYNIEKYIEQYTLRELL